MGAGRSSTVDCDVYSAWAGCLGNVLTWPERLITGPMALVDVYTEFSNGAEL